MTTISVRVTASEHTYVKQLASVNNMTQSNFIKAAIRAYGNESNTENTSSIKEKAVDVVTNPQRISEFSHPLLDLIHEQNITPVDSEGRKIADIRNLTELLDFVQKNVFNNA